MRVDIDRLITDHENKEEQIVHPVKDSLTISTEKSSFHSNKKTTQIQDKYRLSKAQRDANVVPEMRQTTKTVGLSKQIISEDQRKHSREYGLVADKQFDERIVLKDTCKAKLKKIQKEDKFFTDTPMM